MSSFKKGPLNSKIFDYLKFRKSIGFTTRNATYVLNEFDGFLSTNKPKLKIISREIIISYIASTVHLKSRSRQYRVTIIRGFCRHLYQQDYRNYVPEKRILPIKIDQFLPYVFSEAEMIAILNNMQNRSKRKILRMTNVTMITLLWLTGLRLGEACRLNLSDVDFKKRLIYVARSKFYKSRIVPISQSTVSALIYYKQTRLGYYRTKEPSDPFFVSGSGTRVITGGLSKAFRDAVKDLKILNINGIRPRLHDLRHSFATRSLEKVLNSGENQQVKLPALATYLGHVNLDYTQTYLHPSKELLRSAGNRFSSYSKKNKPGAQI